MTIDVIIPLYKPGKELGELLDGLYSQTVPVDNIWLINTEEKYFGYDLSAYHDKVSLTHIDKGEFDHAGTRKRAVEKSKADIFVMMTQDAIPACDDLIEKLVTPLTEEADIAVSYARQIPREDSGAIEYISRIFNYPMESRIKSEQDMDELGIKTYFCSNVCAAYRRDIYDKLGGFIERAIFNEDMIYAAGAVKAGYRIAYAAAAEIYHSHDYDCGQQFRRNFDIGVSQAEHPEVFAGIRSEKEGGKYVKETVYVLKEAREFGLIPYFYLQCACRYAGYLLGKHYKRLPKGLILKCTSNKEYWSKSDNGGEVQPD